MQISAASRNMSGRAFTISLVLVLLSTVAISFPATTEAVERRAETDQASASSTHQSYSQLTRSDAATSAPTNGAAIASACKNTLYPRACERAFGSIARAPLKTPKELFDISVEYAMGHAHKVRSLAYNLTFSGHISKNYPPTGTYDCVELLDTSLEQLTNVLDPNKRPFPDDIDTWLSAALTNQVTCSESLASRPHVGKELVDSQAQTLKRFISNSLALHKSLKGGKAAGTTGNRKLLSDGFPTWVSAGDRKLLKASTEEIRADAVVAQDGSGTHKTIGEALAFVSLATGGSRSVVYVKAGTYKENINIPTKQKNVMLVGDGKGRSVIVGSRSAEDGWTTYQSATVAAMGSGFIAKGLTIINNAGPSKHQAVALRVGADVSVITACSIEGYQDTLYTHSNRQFYRDDDIYGTVDFIFGNSAAVIQNSNIRPRRPNSNQKNSVTAQGRTDPNQNTGISIHRSTIVPTPDLAAVKHQIPTYLGRPWKQYSRTVVLGSYLDDAIHPAGWEPWSGGFALSTLFYGEYGNTGPGASTSGRVRWPGVHPSLSAGEASKFTVAEFIVGNAWLPGTGVQYNAGL